MLPDYEIIFGRLDIHCPGVVLPECAQIAGLPAFDGFGGGFVAGVGSQLVGDDPAAHAGAVGFEVEPAMEFAGTGAVRRWRF